MVKKMKRMEGICLDPVRNEVYLNESYDKFLRTMYGRKFPSQFTAMLNDLLDSGIVETIDDMKKVIKLFEFRLERKRKEMDRIVDYSASVEESLQRVKMYALDLEKRLGIVPPPVSAGEPEDVVMETGDLVKMIEDMKGGDVAAGAEAGVDAGETGIERPKEMSTPTKAAAKLDHKLVEMGAGAEICVDEDDLELTPAIVRIMSKIEEVKGLRALHSDAEIDDMFKVRRAGKKKKRKKAPKDR